MQITWDPLRSLIFRNKVLAENSKLGEYKTIYFLYKIFGFNLCVTSHKGLLPQAPRVITHTTLGDRAFLAAQPKLWNSLPAINIHNEENFNAFKILLKTHFFKLAFN